MFSMACETLFGGCSMTPELLNEIRPARRRVTAAGEREAIIEPRTLRFSAVNSKGTLGLLTGVSRCWKAVSPTHVLLARRKAYHEKLVGLGAGASVQSASCAEGLGLTAQSVTIGAAIRARRNLARARRAQQQRRHGYAGAG